MWQLADLRFHQHDLETARQFFKMPHWLAYFIISHFASEKNKDQNCPSDDKEKVHTSKLMKHFSNVSDAKAKSRMADSI